MYNNFHSLEEIRHWVILKFASLVVDLRGWCKNKKDRKKERKKEQNVEVEEVALVVVATHTPYSGTIKTLDDIKMCITGSRPVGFVQ